MNCQYYYALITSKLIVVSPDISNDCRDTTEDENYCRDTTEDENDGRDNTEDDNDCRNTTEDE